VAASGSGNTRVGRRGDPCVAQSARCDWRRCASKAEGAAPDVARRRGRNVTHTTIDHAREAGLVKDLIALTKPRIISLLLVTTAAPMFVAGSPSFMLVLIVMVGGYLMAG